MAAKKGNAAKTIVVFFGICIYLLLAARALKMDIPLLELSQEEISVKSKNLNISIGIYTGKNPFQLYEPEKVRNPVLTAADVTDIDAEFVADPFMVHTNDKWYLFFEAMNKKSGHGDLGLAESVDGFHWAYRRIILDEPFHLSYPDVFLAEDGYHMIVETNGEKSIRLYKATEFPLTWKYQKNLMEGLPFNDPTIFKYDNTWWLFVATDPHGDGTLRLYYADDIYGAWKEHPQSPIVDGDENIARPGGRVISFNDNLFRIAQDDWPTYGNKLRIFQIDHLTTSEYIEHEICDVPIFDSKSGQASRRVPSWRSDGTHQLDAHMISDGNWLACVDGFNKATPYRRRVVKIELPWTRKKLE